MFVHAPYLPHSRCLSYEKHVLEIIKGNPTQRGGQPGFEWDISGCLCPRVAANLEIPPSFQFLKHEKVLEVAVVVIALEKEGQELAVAIKLKEDSDVSEAELRHFSSEILPAYAVPTYIEIFDDFPRTSSGKINRRQIADIIDQN